MSSRQEQHPSPIDRLNDWLDVRYREQTVVTPLVDSHWQPLGGTWSDRVGAFIDAGVADHINGHNMVHGYDNSYAALVSDALLSGAASVIRHEHPGLSSETMQRVGDALLGAVEAYSMHLDHGVVKISSQITDFIAWDHPLETSIALFGEVVRAVDRKANREGSGAYVYIGNQNVKKEVFKIALSQAIIAQIDAGVGSRRQQFPNERGIQKWTQNIPDNLKLDWYYGLEKSILPWSDTSNDIVSTRLIHPELAIDAIRSGISYLGKEGHDILASSRMLISLYERIVKDTLHTTHSTGELEHKISVLAKSHTWTADVRVLYIQRIIDYTQQFSPAESTDAHHAIALLLLAKELPLMSIRTRSAFDSIIRRGVFHKDPAVRRVCFNAMVYALEAPGITRQYAETLRKRVFYKLFPGEPTPHTAGYWQELMSIASLPSIETWLSTASTTTQVDSIGKIAWNAFQTEYEQKIGNLTEVLTMQDIAKYATVHESRFKQAEIDVSWFVTHFKAKVDSSF